MRKGRAKGSEDGRTKARRGRKEGEEEGEEGRQGRVKTCPQLDQVYFFAAKV
jgi:hypothetical protein